VRARFSTVLAAALATVASVLVGTGVAQAQPVVNPNKVSVVETVPGTSTLLAPQPSITFTPGTPAYGLPVIAIDEAIKEQVVQGFGGSMTDSSAWLIEHWLTPTARAQLLSDLFGPSGIRLDFLRIPIGASDYTATETPYTYDDLPPGQTDPTLQQFSIKHDQAYILPALKQALQTNPHIDMLASPWTAPAWMKRNDSLSNVQNTGTLRGEFYSTWARYIVKFLQAYEAAGVPISAVTAQNEPGNPTPYPGMNMSADSLGTFTVRDLSPALRAAGLKTQIYGLDLGWGSASLAYQLTAGEMPELGGVAWHCYYGSPDVMETLHTELPSVTQIVDECSPGITPISTSEVVISSLRNWASTVALWNLALDRLGGPVEQPNKGCPGCYGLATIVPTNTNIPADDQVWLSTAYYELGQASTAIEPGARVVGSTNFVNYDYLKPGVNFVSPSVDDVAVVNPDGTRALMAFNNGTASASFAVQWNSEYFDYTLPPRATVTFVWDH